MNNNNFNGGFPPIPMMPGPQSYTTDVVPSQPAPAAAACTNGGARGRT